MNLKKYVKNRFKVSYLESVHRAFSAEEVQSSTKFSKKGA